jgi:phage-related protein
MVLLHAFVKKSQKTPKHELDVALKRMKEVISHEGKSEDEKVEWQPAYRFVGA